MSFLIFARVVQSQMTIEIPKEHFQKTIDKLNQMFFEDHPLYKQAWDMVNQTAESIKNDISHPLKKLYKLEISYQQLKEYHNEYIEEEKELTNLLYNTRKLYYNISCNLYASLAGYTITCPTEKYVELLYDESICPEERLYRARQRLDKYNSHITDEKSGRQIECDKIQKEWTSVQFTCRYTCFQLLHEIYGCMPDNIDYFLLGDAMKEIFFYWLALTAFMFITYNIYSKLNNKLKMKET
jgi:hypothetical protein